MLAEQTFKRHIGASLYNKSLQKPVWATWMASNKSRLGELLHDLCGNLLDLLGKDLPKHPV
jgi:hypothetical protein